MRATHIRLFFGHVGAFETTRGNVILAADKTDKTPTLMKLTFLTRETANEQVNKYIK